MTLKEEKIIVANADTNILNLLNTIIKRHINVIREGWVREVTKCQHVDVNCFLLFIVIKLYNKDHRIIFFILF